MHYPLPDKTGRAALSDGAGCRRNPDIDLPLWAVRPFRIRRQQR